MAEAKKKTASKKAPAKKAPAKKTEPVKQESTKRFFYFPKSRGASFSWSRQVGEVSVPVRIVAVNHIIVADVATPTGKETYERLSKHRRNEANGGSLFKEVLSKEANGTSEGAKLDVLMALDEPALVTMLGGEMELHRLSKGELVSKAMKL